MSVLVVVWKRERYVCLFVVDDESFSHQPVFELSYYVVYSSISSSTSTTISHTVSI